MIELRKFPRFESLNIGGKIVKRRVEDLQYRLLFLPTLTASGDIVLYQNPDPKWLDIPTVKESDDGMDKR